MQTLAPTGTAELLQTLSPWIPDQFINELLARRPHPGARPKFSPAQLWRTHLLALLTPAHTFNAVVRLLPEQPQWRQFARLPNRRQIPDVCMLHQFRAQAGVSGLRRINDYLVQQLLPRIAPASKTVAIIDATDLPAATPDKKKTKNEAAGRPNAPPWEPVPSSPDALAFLWAIKSIRCACGGGPIQRRCCWCR